MSLPTLDGILEAVRHRTEERARSGPSEAELEGAERGAQRPFRQSLEAEAFAIIAEIKRASPSAGPRRPELTPAELAREYQEAGARAISVLTCGPWFEGSYDDLRAVREAVDLPVLCKDFLVSRRQVLEAAAAGADALLLIAAALDDGELRELSALATERGMEILYEAHDAAELERLTRLDPAMVGVNSRNLKTMEVVAGAALELGPRLPPGCLGVFESGVKTPKDLSAARAAGYRVALIGETLLRAERPGDALRALGDEVRP